MRNEESFRNGLEKTGPFLEHSCFGLTEGECYGRGI